MTAEMDEAYQNAAYIPGGAEYPARWEAAAAAFRAKVAVTEIAYGSGARERFDLFRPARAAQGCVIFVHGGYWKAFDRSLWSHLAAGPLARGWAVAMPSYDLCPGVRISGITTQIARAVDAVAGAVAGPLVLTGHSAGGHLVARMGCDDVGLRAWDRVARIVPISPVSDLRPLRQTAMNEVLRIDAAEAMDESPVMFGAPGVPVHVWVGGAERPAFLDQARWLAEGWRAALTIEPERHHFDVIAGLERADSPLCAAVFGE